MTEYNKVEDWTGYSPLFPVTDPPQDRVIIVSQFNGTGFWPSSVFTDIDKALTFANELLLQGAAVSLATVVPDMGGLLFPTVGD